MIELQANQPTLAEGVAQQTSLGQDYPDHYHSPQPSKKYIHSYHEERVNKHTVNSFLYLHLRKSIGGEDQ